MGQAAIVVRRGAAAAPPPQTVALVTQLPAVGAAADALALLRLRANDTEASRFVRDTTNFFHAAAEAVPPKKKTT